MIDTNFVFTDDTPENGDPDKLSPTLRKYHQLLWSKQLPNGEIMDLKPVDDFTYLQWKDLRLSSDSIIVELRYAKYQYMVDQVGMIIKDIDDFYYKLIRRSYTIGGMILFPQHPGSMNQNRGTNRKISDRWDLTLECIRRYYNGEDSPLSETIKRDKEFFDLFVDFKGYVDFFFLQDCVTDDYSKVNIWSGDASFDDSGLPATIFDYLGFLVKEHEFLDNRNKRIKEYCRANNL